MRWLPHKKNLATHPFKHVIDLISRHTMVDEINEADILEGLDNCVGHGLLLSTVEEETKIYNGHWACSRKKYGRIGHLDVVLLVNL